jgi:hypothetical protein
VRVGLGERFELTFEQSDFGDNSSINVVVVPFFLFFLFFSFYLFIIYYYSSYLSLSPVICIHRDDGLPDRTGLGGTCLAFLRDALEIYLGDANIFGGRDLKN